MFGNIKGRIDNNELTIGSWIQTGNLALMEIMSLYPFDWLTIDMEHTDISNSDFANLVRVSNNLPVFARVKENDVIAIRQVLDLGAAGVIVPLVNNVMEAEKAVSAAKFPPKGIRGFAYFRANDYGINFDEYVKHANNETVVIAMIETKEAVNNIEDILAVKGIDGIIIGPYDLSGSYGIPGRLNEPIIKDAIKTVCGACKKFNKPAGFHQVGIDKEKIEEAFNYGFRFIAIGMDTCFLKVGLDTAFGMINGARK